MVVYKKNHNNKFLSKITNFLYCKIFHYIRNEKCTHTFLKIFKFQKKKNVDTFPKTNFQRNTYK